MCMGTIRRLSANAAGILYNKDMFEQNGWEIPETWSEFISLCDEIKASGTDPLYLGYKDTWTCLAPWNALAVGLAPSDVCSSVNSGRTTFAAEYAEVADKIKVLLDYAEPNPCAYSYNDASLCERAVCNVSYRKLRSTADTLGKSRYEH